MPAPKKYDEETQYTGMTVDRYATRFREVPTRCPRQDRR